MRGNHSFLKSLVEDAMNSMNRRDALGRLALGGAATVLLTTTDGARAQGAAAPQATLPPAYAGKHEVVPLPFAPTKLKGISEKMIVSHHDNNYASAVKNLQKVEGELASVTKDTPAFIVNGLKERELTYTNSKVLHEHYFGNLGGDGAPSGAIVDEVKATYGDWARWEAEFRQTGAALGGGSGWVILDYNLYTGAIRTYWAGGHSQTAATGLPLLVMDMYEHAYQMDYGAAAAKYVDAFFMNVNYDEVNRRLTAARAAVSALRPASGRRA
jgi:Fe-Mn family superoxide dismutase